VFNVLVIGGVIIVDIMRKCTNSLTASRTSLVNYDDNAGVLKSARFKKSSSINYARYVIGEGAVAIHTWWQWLRGATRVFAYYRHISGAALNLASHPIKVSTVRWEQRRKKKGLRKRRWKSKDSIGEKWRNQPGSIHQGVLSTFPREQPMWLMRKSAFLRFAPPCCETCIALPQAACKLCLY